MKIPRPYFSAALPIIITEPGKYITRSGEVVEVLEISTSRRSMYSAHGVYSDGVREAWHKSGRIFPTIDTVNDIVKKA